MANIIVNRNQRNYSVDELIAKSAGLNCLLDPQQFEAIKIYMLALILKALGGADATNICEVFDEVKSYDSLSDYQRRALYIEILIQIAEGLGVDDAEMTEAKMREQLACWCSTSKQTMALSEILLLYLILLEFGLN